MREIKFRAWNRANNTMNFFTLQEALFNSYKKTPFGITNIDIMQYTGLKDKNDEEIYEGDIVKWNETNVGVVIYNDSSYQIKVKPFVWYLISAMSYKLKIIGNMYENNEDLLK